MTPAPGSTWLRDWAAETRRVDPPAAVREVTPSRHDFHQALTSGRQALAVVAQFSRRTPEEGELPAGVELASWLTRCDEAGVAGVALPSTNRFGTNLDDLHTARQLEIPLLHYQPCLSKDDVVRSRLLGADAVWTHMGMGPAVAEILENVRAFHMCALVEVCDEAQRRAALKAGARVLCWSAFDDSGALDLDAALESVDGIPSSITRVVRGPVSNRAAFDPLRGRVDAVWLCGPALVAVAVGSDLEVLVRAAEGS